MAYLAVWLLGGLLLAGVLVDAALATWAEALTFALPGALCLGFACTSAYHVCRAVVLSRRAALQNVLVFAVASLAAGGMWTLLCMGWNAVGSALLALAGADGLEREPAAPASVAVRAVLVVLPHSGLLMLLLVGSASYLIALLMHDVWLAADQVRSAQERETHSHLQAREAQLQVLRTQINPHFLFNSLNSISALTTQDAAAARAMTLELAAFFRKTLALAEKDRITLADELALCQHFLAVERIRFGDRLRTDIEASAAAQAVLIPPMILQPCVENAVKHGVRHLIEGGCVTLRAFVQGPWLYVTIDNPVDPDFTDATTKPKARSSAPHEGVRNTVAAGQSPAGSGVGLANTRQRLATAYGDQARIQWTRRQDHFALELVLPTGVST